MPMGGYMQDMEPGAPQQPMFFDPEMIGAIKIKDGLFIGDELASTVSEFYFIVAGPRVRCCK